MNKLSLHSPASLMDMATLTGPTSSVRWGVMRQIWRESTSFGFLSDGVVFATAGFWPLPEGGFEAWFNFSPQAARHMGFIVRQVRLTLQSGAYDGAVTLATTKFGARLARLCGMEFQIQTPMGEVWAYGYSNRIGRKEKA